VIGNSSVASNLGRVGLWTRQLDGVPGAAAQDAVAEVEALGYGCVWIPEAVRREVISHATLLLAGSSRVVIATGIARVHARAAQAAALAQVLLDDRFPGRFVLGLGVSHQIVVERMMGQHYGKPLDVMSSYLDAVDVALHAAQDSAGDATHHRVIAALGPKMMALAAARAGGAHTYMAPVEHTRWARSVLGPRAMLAPAVKVVLDTNLVRAGEIARSSIGPTLRTPAYSGNLGRFGYTDDEIGRDPSDRVVDALVCCGDVAAIVARVREHLDAGADHVCVEVLTGDDTTVPLAAWRELAPALTTLG